MILVDTSVWADHFRASDSTLANLIARGEVLMHPFVLGELAMGNLLERKRTVAALSALAEAPLAPASDLLAFVDEQDLGGSGLGFVDAHLLISAVLCGATIWTRDRRLAERAAGLSLRWAI